MNIRRLALLGLAASLTLSTTAYAADPIKIAYIDPLSGGMANVGEEGVKNFQFVLDQINARGGVLGGRKFELVPLDNKLSPQESLVQLQNAADQKIQFITQGNGSSVAGALIDGVNKYNARNPDNRILFLNYAAVDPDFTNSKCSFWHFRFDANSDMKMQALTDLIKRDPKIKKVYLIDQDYSFGHQVEKAALEMLGKKRPDIKIVGDDFHPLAQVKDFAPYVAKIKASGADTVITGNWGNDLSLLVKAGKDAGLNVNYFTYYGGGLGSPGAIGESGVGKVRQISEWHNNVPNVGMEMFYASYKKRFTAAKDDYYYYRVKEELEMLARAIERAKTTDPLKVALALEGMTYNAGLGDATMRKEDHQLIQPMYISLMEKEGSPGVRRDVEGTGFGFKTIVEIPAKDQALPTTCKMERP